MEEDVKLPQKLELTILQEECALPVLKKVVADFGFGEKDENYKLHKKNEIILLTRPEKVCLLNPMDGFCSRYKKTLEVGHAAYDENKPTIYVVYDLDEKDKTE